MTSFQIAVQFLLDPRDGYDAEGGYINDPKDPGGETNYGISKRNHPDVDIKNLTLQGAMEIYQKEYWDVNKLDIVPIPLCIVLLDSYVQHRPSVVDQMRKVSDDDWKLIIALRRNFYLRLIQKKPDLKKFQNGWMNRLNSLSKYCTIILQDQTP